MIAWSDILVLAAMIGECGVAIILRRIVNSTELHHPWTTMTFVRLGGGLILLSALALTIRDVWLHVWLSSGSHWAGRALGVLIGIFLFGDIRILWIYRSTLIYPTPAPITDTKALASDDGIVVNTVNKHCGQISPKP